MRLRTSTLVISTLTALSGCTDDDPAATTDATAHSLFVAHEGVLTAYDINTGEQRPGEVQGVTTPVDLQALSDGHLMVNLTDRGEILVIDGATMLERARISTTGGGGLRPVHSFVSSDESLWLTLNDGEEGAGNSAVFVDIAVDSPTRFEQVGEVALGVGHHKASLSATKQRVVISNIGDCDDVLSVYDYSDLGNIVVLATLTAEQAGWDGTSFATTCDPTYQMGVPPAPHGCATSKVSGKAYCNLTSSGDLVAVDIDADPPTFALIPTGGSGAGYTTASKDGRYVYSLQETPRENDMGDPGATCQIGQLVVIDAMSDSVAAEVPLFYDGPSCDQAILGTPAATANPGKAIVHDDHHLFIATAGGFGVDDARVSQHLLLDISDPTSPVQLPSLASGASTSHVGATLAGDFVFTADNVEGTVTQMDCEAGTVARTFQTEATPKTVATWGSAEGAGYQTGPIH